MSFFKMIKEVLYKQLEIGIYLLPFTLFDFILKIFIPFALSLFFYKLIKKTILKSLKKSKLSEEKRESTSRWIRVFLRFVLFVLTIIYITNLLGAKITDYLTAFIGVLTHPIVEDISIVTIMLIIPIIYLARLAGKIVEKFARSSIFPYLKIKSGTSNMAETIFKNIAVALVLLFGLTLIGFNLSLLYGLFGIIGIGIGFGLQGAVANLFAGMILLSTKPVKVGDHIIVDGKEGDLKEIRFINSIISTIEHETIIIPNTQLIDNPVHNYSFDDKHIKIKNSVQVSYDSDLERALELLSELAKECPQRLKKQDIETRVVSFDDSGITLMVITWISNSADKYQALSWINLEIWKIFKSNNIEIPYPKLDISVARKS